MELKIGEQYKVTIKKVIPSGAIVTVPGDSDGFVHKSKISNDFVDDVNNFLRVGEEYIADVIIGNENNPELTLKVSNDIVKKANVVEHKPEYVVYTPAKTKEAVTLEDMIARSTETMQEKYQGRDKYTGGRIKKNRRGYKNKNKSK